jgi:hypothetical protein
LGAAEPNMAQGARHGGVVAAAVKRPPQAHSPRLLVVTPTTAPMGTPRRTQSPIRSGSGHPAAPHPAALSSTPRRRDGPGQARSGRAAGMALSGDLPPSLRSLSRGGGGNVGSVGPEIGGGEDEGGRGGSSGGESKAEEWDDRPPQTFQCLAAGGNSVRVENDWGAEPHDRRQWRKFEADLLRGQVSR